MEGLDESPDRRGILVKRTCDYREQTGPSVSRSMNAWIEILAAVQLFFAGCFLLASFTFVHPSWRDIPPPPFHDMEVVNFALAWGSLFLLAAGLLLVSAVGLFFHKQWGRALTLMLAWFFLFLGFLLPPVSIFLDLEEFLPMMLAPYMPSWTVICWMDSILCVVFSGIAFVILLPGKMRAFFV